MHFLEKNTTFPCLNKTLTFVYTSTTEIKYIIFAFNNKMLICLFLLLF